MKTIKCLSIVFSLFFVAAANASVIRTFSITGVGATKSAAGAPLQLNGSTIYDPATAFLDSEGILTFTISGLSTTNVLEPTKVTEAVTIYGSYSNGLFTPNTSQRRLTTQCTVGLCAPMTYSEDSYSRIDVATPNSIYAITTNNFLITNTRTFMFSEVCGTGAAPSCGTALFPSVVPIPASLWLFGSGLMGLAVFRKRQDRDKLIVEFRS